MARILAIDWDRREARALLMLSGPTGTSVTEAWSAALDSPEGTVAGGQQVGRRLAAAMDGYAVGKATTIVGVSRDHVQMKLLTLPPAPADELPEMVRFQAEREFTALGEAAALDFIPLAGDAQTPHQVLAVALSPAGVKEVNEICAAIHVEPERITLRASAVASLVERAGAVQAGQVVLIVNPLIDEADFTVLADNRVVLMRTVRLPDPTQLEARGRTMDSEVRRTVAAVRQQLGDRQVDRVLICGHAAATDQLSTLLQELDLPVGLVDVAERAPAGLDRSGLSSDSTARFGAVLGMALAESDRRPPIVDFLNVRRRAVRRQFGRIHALAAAAALVAVLAGGIHLWRQVLEPTRELARVQAEIRDLQPVIQQYDQVVAQAAAIEGWLATDVTWLDELDEVSRRVRPVPLADSDYPVASDVLVQQLTLLRPPGRDAVGGRIDVTQAVAKSASAVTELVQRLRSERYGVTISGDKEDGSVPGYEWGFTMQVNVAPDESAEEAGP